MTPSQSPATANQETIDRLNGWLRANFVRYQLGWIFEQSSFAVHNKARQIGVSDAIAGDAVVHGHCFRRPQIVLSANEDLSSEVLDKARNHCKTLAAVGFADAVRFSVDSATEIAWYSGGRIVALPANKRTARSYSGDVHLDEFAYHEDPEGIRDGAFPMASRLGWRIRIISTPNGAQGLFHDYVTNLAEGWALHTTSIDDAELDGFPVDRAKLMQMCGGDERLFAQWFLCAFIDADLQYFPTGYVDKAFLWRKRPDLSTANIVAGLDVGRESDLTVLTVLAVTADGHAWRIASLHCKRTKFKAQRKMVDDARKMLGFKRLVVDETGLGKQFAEELVEAYGEEEVEALTFTNEAKADLATRGLRFLRGGKLHVPTDDEGKALRAEMVALRRQVTPAGNIVYHSPRTRLGHGDRLWSLLCALRAADQPELARGMFTGFGQGVSR